MPSPGGHLRERTLHDDAGLADAVNITIGLPIIRASVDHGAAFDIAWQEKADNANFTTACVMAEKN